MVGAVGWGGATLDIPDSVDPGLAAIISVCWREPEARPSFGQLITSIRVSWRELAPNTPWAPHGAYTVSWLNSAEVLVVGAGMTWMVLRRLRDMSPTLCLFIHHYAVVGYAAAVLNRHAQVPWLGLWWCTEPGGTVHGPNAVTQSGHARHMPCTCEPAVRQHVLYSRLA